LSNAEEALFSLENLDTLTSMMVQENNSLRLRIYSYNQKGRSSAYLLPDFIIGSTAYKTGEWHNQPPDGAAEKRTAQFALIDG